MICQCKDEDCTCYGKCQAFTHLEVTDHFLKGLGEPTTTQLCERCILHGIESRLDEQDSSLTAAFYESNYAYTRENSDKVRKVFRFTPESVSGLTLVEAINKVLE